MIIRNIIKQHKRNLKEFNNGIKKTSDVQQIISKNHSYNEKGITLVALIVTIIVLLILSGITIASFKQSNIITRAKSSAKRYSASQINEKIDLAQQDLVVERQGYDYSIKDLVDEVKKENKDIDTIFVDESNNGRKGTYIIDDYFYDFTKKDDGIIVYNRKADASDKDKEKYENKIELKDLKSGIITFKNDKKDWTNENVNVTIGAKTDDKSIQEKIDNGTYFVVSTVNDATKLTTLTKSVTSQVATNQGDTIYACLTDGYGTYVATATEKIDIIDKTAPTDAKPIAKTTTNSITVTNNQEDKPGTTETKASGIKTTQYQIKKNEDATWGALQSSGTFTGLTQGIKYDVRTQVIDNAGNKTTSQITTVTTGTISAVGKATASTTTWTNKDVTVTLPTLTGFTTKYTTNGTAPSTSSATYSSPFTVSTNCTVMYVYTDETNINSAGTLTIDNIDKTAPTNTAPTATNTTNSITVTCKQADNAGTNEKASGIAKTEYSKDGGKTWQASNVFSGLKQNAAYTIKTRVTDKAGNVTESQTLSVTTGTISAVGKATASPTGWTNKDVTVTLPTLTGFTTKYTTNGTAPSTSSAAYSSPFTVSTNCTVMYVYTDGTNINSAGTLTIDNIDKTAPTNTAPTATHTTNSITVTCKQADNAGTNEKASGIAKTEYSKDGGKTWQASNVFSGLKQNAAYTIKTKVTDKAGNVTESQTLSVTTGTIGAVGTATATPTTLTSGDVTVTLPTLTGFTTKYTTNGTAPSTSSATYTGPFTVSSNCTVLFVYTDETNINSAGTLGITNIDKTAYTITYNLNGGSISGQPTTYKVDTANITLPTPTRTGYTFNGWTGSNGTTAQKSVTIAKGSRGNKTYTANWEVASLPTTTNYTGKYVDCDNNGTPDGLILTDNQTGTAYALNSNGYVIKTGSGSRFLLMRTQDWSTSSSWYDAVRASETIGSTTFSTPSFWDLQEFYGHRLSGYYWSSTEDDSNRAYRVGMDSGSTGNDTKANFYKVRLCATF